MGRTWRTRAQKKQPSRGVSLGLDEPVIELKRWLRSKGWMNETNLKLYWFPTTGRGVCTKKGVSENDVLTEIPVEAMITRETVTASEIGMNEAESGLSTHELLGLFLCVERHKLECQVNALSGGEWSVYLKSLPNVTPPLPYFCTDSELSLLPADLRLKIINLKERLMTSYKNVLQSAEAKCKRCRNNFLTSDLYNWGYTMVNTRSVHFYKGEMALCPYLDMFNHSDKANSSVEMSLEGKMYVLKTHNSYGKFEQIFISYGPHNNEKLMLEYGFYIPFNRYDTIPVSFDDIVKLMTSLGYSTEPKQYKYAQEKFSADLNVSLEAISYNLKALLYVFLHPELNDWSANVYSESYSTDDEAKMCEVIKIYVTQNVAKVKITEGCNYTEPMKNIISYLAHKNELRDVIIAQLGSKIK